MPVLAQAALRSAMPSGERGLLGGWAFAMSDIFWASRLLPPGVGRLLVAAAAAAAVAFWGAAAPCSSDAHTRRGVEGHSNGQGAANQGTCWRAARHCRLHLSCHEHDLGARGQLVAGEGLVVVQDLALEYELLLPLHEACEGLQLLLEGGDRAGVRQRHPVLRLRPLLDYQLYAAGGSSSSSHCGAVGNSLIRSFTVGKGACGRWWQGYGTSLPDHSPVIALSLRTDRV